MNLPLASALVSVLDEAQRHAASRDLEVRQALEEIGREEVAARQALDEARRRIAALGALRGEYELRRERERLDAAAEERRAVREGVARDRETLLTRARALAEVEAARRAEVARRLEDEPDLAAALQAAYRFRELEPTLGEHPPSYRKALHDEHRRALRRLAPVRSLVDGPPPPLALPMAGTAVLLATEPEVGVPEALVVVLPVPFAVYRAWTTRPEDLAARLAYRAIGAVFGLLAGVGAADAPIRYLDLHGSLAVQVWLGDSPVPEDFRDRTMDQLNAAWEQAPDLGAAGLEVYGVWVRPDLLLEEES